MLKNYTYVLAVSLVILTSCREDTKKENAVALLNVIDSPSGEGSSLPFLFSGGNNLWMSWVEKEGDSMTKLRYASMEGGKWQAPKDIAEGTDWFVNWADFPVIVANGGNLLSHVLKKSSAGTYSYDVKLNLFPEGGQGWETDMPLHTDDTPTEHGFVSAIPYTNGTFFVTWLDGRNTEELEGKEGGAMTIRAAQITADGDILNEALLDERTCDCCQTTAAMTDNGPVVVYRDRTAEEVRDISIVRKVDGEWTAPKTVYADGWKIKGCPVNGPKAAAWGNNLVVAWFTAAGEKPMVKLAFSADGGEYFDNPISITETNTMGRVDVLLLDEDTAIVSWMEFGDDSMAGIKTVKVTRSGDRSEVIEIAKVDASRQTGFPQMERVGDTIYFAWTDVSGNNSEVKTAYVMTQAY